MEGAEVALDGGEGPGGEGPGCSTCVLGKWGRGVGGLVVSKGGGFMVCLRGGGGAFLWAVMGGCFFSMWDCSGGRGRGGLQLKGSLLCINHLGIAY